MILVLILAAVGFGLYRVLPASTGSAEKVEYHLEFVIDEMRDEVNVLFKAGDPVFERAGLAPIGTISNVELRPTRTYATTEEGLIFLTTRPGAHMVVITVEGTGTLNAAKGILNDGKDPYYVNRFYDLVFDNINASARVSAITTQ